MTGRKRTATQLSNANEHRVAPGLLPDVDMTDYTEARLSAEEKWYALTGRVVEAKVEAVVVGHHLTDQSPIDG